MKVSELIDRTSALLKMVANKSAKQATEAHLLIKELSHLKGWAYPQLTTDDIVRVVRCKRCCYYKRYRKKGNHKSLPVWACSHDRVKRDPNFYCASGVEKEDRGTEVPYE